jgi:hypothetical protein
MTNWRTHLEAGDPGRDGVMEPADVARIRRAVLIAVRQPPAVPSYGWGRSAAFVSAMLIVAIAGAGSAFQAGLRKEASLRGLTVGAEAPADADAPADDRQQLQFATPGGTRIIWVFDSQFEMRGTLP